MNLKNLLLAAALCGLFAAVNPAFAQGTAFTYQGRLNQNGNPANGNYDFRFRVSSDSQGNYYVGSSVVVSDLSISGGLFTVTLDFGAGIFYGSNYWLQIEARTNGNGGYTTLSPLQSFTPAPYAIMANAASNLLGTLPAVQLSGTLAPGQLSGTYNSAVTFNNPADSFSGNGAGLANVNAAALSGLAANQFWQLGGNSGTAGNNFVGTADNQPLELRVNGARALRLEPNTNGAPNVIGGSLSNLVDTGVQGSFIGGGGVTNLFGLGYIYPNRVSSDFCVIGGGYGNAIQTGSFNSLVGGGVFNTIRTNSPKSAIIGGQDNFMISQSLAFIGGGFINQMGGSSRGSFAALGPDQANTIAGGGGNFIAQGAIAGAIGGGANNIISNSAYFATIPGGANNVASGSYSFAAGQMALAFHNGSFVWADDSSGNPFASTGTNQFLIRAAGGVGIGVNNPGMSLDIGGRVRVRDGGGNTAGLWLNTFFTPYGSGNQDIGFIGVLDATRIGFYGNDPRGAIGWGLTFDTSTGNVGIGTGNTYPTYKLQVNGSVAGVGAYNNISDARYKTNVVQIARALEAIQRLRGVRYDWREKEFPTLKFDSGRQLGFIAQEVKEVLPEAVSVDAEGVHSIAYTKIIPVLVEGIKEQQDQLRARDTKIAELEKEVAGLKSAQQQAGADSEARFAALQKIVARLARQADALVEK